jgi:lipopolysaccharide export system permease protein
MEMESKRGISVTLFKYILTEAFFSFFICFLFFFFVFFVNQILLMAKEVLAKHVPLGQVALLILFSLPTVIAMSAPFASLVGTLMTVGRLTSDNEILVMLSSGLSYLNIFLPAIVMGIIISIMSFITNDVLLPAGTVQFNKLWRRILFSTPSLELEANSVKKFKGTAIITGDVTDNTIKNVMIIDKTSDGERRVIMASEAELKDGGNEGLSLGLENAFILSSKEIVREDYDYASASFLQYWISNEDIMQTVMSVSPREMSSWDVRKAIKQKNVDVGIKANERKGKLVIQAANLENILRKGPPGESWSRKSATITNFQREAQTLAGVYKDRSLRLHIIEYFKKFSMPFAAFFFVFLAVPLGLMAKKSGQTVGFMIGIIIAVIYWSMLFVGQTMALRIGTSPFWSMWLPNILSLAIGLALAVVRVRK